MFDALKCRLNVNIYLKKSAIFEYCTWCNIAKKKKVRLLVLLFYTEKRDCEKHNTKNNFSFVTISIFFLSAIFRTFAVRNVTKRNEQTKKIKYIVIYFVTMVYSQKCSTKRKKELKNNGTKKKKEFECEIRVALQLDTK